MKYKDGLFFSLLIIAFTLTAGCDGGGGGGGSSTLTGTITGGTTVKVGLFSAAEYWFEPVSGGEPDEVEDVFGDPEPYTPLVLGTIDAGVYSITLPSPSSYAAYYLVIWDDTNDDDMWSDSTETGYFPWHDSPEGLYPVIDIVFEADRVWIIDMENEYDSPVDQMLYLRDLGTDGYDVMVD